MDGGRRVLRSLRAKLSIAAPVASTPAFAGHHATPAPRASRSHAHARTRPMRLHALAAHPVTTLLFCAIVLGGAAGYGAVRGGAFTAYVARNGAPGDLIAGALGLGLETITIGGLTELKETEILDAAGISNRNSLLFLDAQDVRAKLMTLALVQDAAVRKLYPSRISIVITERQPFALWQKEGRVAIVSADGTVIDSLRDDRFAALPFVVGEGANAHLDEYAALLEAAGDMKARIKAGVRVSDRRWDLITTDGVTLRLPEERAVAAVALVAKLAREQRLLDKDIVALDLRDPTRLAVRLSDDAGAARAETLARRLSGKGKA